MEQEYLLMLKIICCRGNFCLHEESMGDMAYLFWQEGGEKCSNSCVGRIQTS